MIPMIVMENTKKYNHKVLNENRIYRGQAKPSSGLRNRKGRAKASSRICRMQEAEEKPKGE